MSGFGKKYPLSAIRARPPVHAERTAADGDGEGAAPSRNVESPLGISPAELGRQWTINGRFFAQNVTGVQRYACEILKALDDLLSNDPDLASRLALRLALPPGAVSDRAGFSHISVCRTKFGSGHGWDQLVLPFYTEGGVLSLGNFGPLLAGNHILCIHDANVFIQPESYSLLFRLAYRTLLPLIGNRATKVATVSRFSADMLVRYGVCRREQIFLAPNGHEHALRWDAKRAKALAAGAVKQPFILLLGSRAKHKNIEIILEQAAVLEAAGIDIVVVGGASGIFSAGTPSLSRPNVHYAGYLSDDDLAALYERALCLVFPSRTEGFGLPPLEAMTLGCPVICSKAGSLVEVSGDAATYIDADDAEGWRQNIIALSRNQGIRAAMSERGRKRAALFSWRRSAQVYIEEMQRLANCRFAAGKSGRLAVANN